MFQMFSQIYKTLFGADKTSTKSMSAGDAHHNDAPTMSVEKLRETVARLEGENNGLRQNVAYRELKESEFKKVLANYETAMRKTIADHRSVQREHDDARYHLTNLEKAFYDLLQKYERAKVVVQGFQSNEKILRKQLEDYEKLVGEMKRACCISNEVKETSGSRSSFKTNNNKGDSKKTSPGGTYNSKKRRLLTTM